MKPKRVLLAASVASMIDQFNLSNIRLLLDLGYEVHVMCNFRQGNTCSRKRILKLLHQLRDMQVVCHPWDCPRSIRDVAGCVRAYRQMCRLLLLGSFAWVHCHSPIGGALSRIAAHRQGIPVIYTAHGFHFYKGAPLWNWLLYYPAEKLLAHWTDVLVTVNREDYRVAKHRLKAGRICHIPGVGIDGKAFEAASHKKDSRFCACYQIPQDALVLLSVGELNAGKNHRMVLQALAALGRRDVCYLICGQGRLRDELWRYAKELGIRALVRMPGYQEDMPWIYGNADIFVFPSRREGLSVSLLEAMAASLPCVVSDIRGNRELIRPVRAEDASGVCLAPGGARFSLDKPWQLTAALHRLLEDEALRKRCGAYNRNRMQDYSRPAVEQRMRKIYRYVSQLGCAR
ncbi:MAG: glycosyltransferase [Eubacterium sp.]|nr:glycosyltransferase [Eubacterium sp.]